MQWSPTELGIAIVGLLAIAVGAYAAVRATENIATALGISQIVTGIFITAVVSAAPEAFSTRSAIQSGQVTAGSTAVIGDKAVTMSIAFVPLGLVTVPIQNFQLYWVSLAFVALMPTTFAALIHVGSSEPAHGFKRWQVLVLDGFYLAYAGVTVFWVLNIFENVFASPLLVSYPRRILGGCSDVHGKNRFSEHLHPTPESSHVSARSVCP